MQAMVSDHLAAPRFRTLLLAMFAGLAICLAMAGVYGVMAWSVAQRVPEIGLRLALGASSNAVVRLIVRNGMAMACLGLAIGLAVSTAVTRLFTSALFEVRPNDPGTYVIMAALVSAGALAASYVPARRAATIDPIAAIREE
jgi:putative ABC transport system permease protein